MQKLRNRAISKIQIYKNQKMQNKYFKKNIVLKTWHLRIQKNCHYS